MKNLKTLAVIAFAALSTTLVSAQTKAKAPQEKAQTQGKNIDVAKSTIKWTGKKVTGQHEGTINFKEGTLLFKNNKLERGKFTVDMNSIAVTDLKAGEGKEKLEGHLKADDFFGTDKFATASIMFTKVTPKANGVYTVTANLKIKEKTNPVTFDITVKGNTATANLVVDRTKYDIKYGSGSFFDNLGDKAISDNFDLAVSLQF
ncbi:YceI family protein [Flavobacterium sp.]|uniref:YceI family protein n=1 Tax=Flavobacterium sp. TaxID=239 RepID=UPI0026023967|nr:YceI family protein [Flavobacterium sp.]